MNSFGQIKRACNGVVGDTPEAAIKEAYRNYCHLNGRIMRESEFRARLEEWNYHVVPERDSYVIRSKV